MSNYQDQRRVVSVNYFGPIMTSEKSQKMLISILSGEQAEMLLANREIDLAYSLNVRYRFRVNLYYAGKIYAVVFDYIKEEISTMEQLSLPTIMDQCADYRPRSGSTDWSNR